MAVCSNPEGTKHMMIVVHEYSENRTRIDCKNLRVIRRAALTDSKSATKAAHNSILTLSTDTMHTMTDQTAYIIHGRGAKRAKNARTTTCLSPDQHRHRESERERERKHSLSTLNQGQREREREKEGEKDDYRRPTVDG